MIFELRSMSWKLERHDQLKRLLERNKHCLTMALLLKDGRVKCSCCSVSEVSDEICSQQDKSRKKKSNRFQTHNKGIFRLRAVQWGGGFK